MSDTFTQLTERLTESYALSMSPVSYIAEVLKQYGSAEISKSQLISEYAQKTRQAFFYLSHMPQEDIAENKRLFKNEFALANSITDVIQGQTGQVGLQVQDGSNDNRFDAMLEKCMEDYLTAVNQK